MGPVREDAAFIAQGQDLTWVPGYSDKRMAMEESARKGEEPTTGLNHRLHWVTVQRPNGRPDHQKMTQFKAQGYRPVPFDEVSSFGIEVPVQAEKTPDGFIKVGDTVLMACSAAVAARIEEQGRRAIDERTANDFTANTLHQAGREVGGVRGDIVTSDTQQRVEVTKG